MLRVLVRPEGSGKRSRLAENLKGFAMTSNQDLEKAQLTLPVCRALNAGQVGARLGCSSRHVFRMADAGLMPWGFKLLALRRWDADEIERWISAGCPTNWKKGGRDE